MTILSQGHASASAPAAACTALRDMAVSIFPGPPPPAAECQSEDILTISMDATHKYRIVCTSARTNQLLSNHTITAGAAQACQQRATRNLLSTDLCCILR